MPRQTNEFDRYSLSSTGNPMDAGAVEMDERALVDMAALCSRRIRIASELRGLNQTQLSKLMRNVRIAPRTVKEYQEATRKRTQISASNLLALSMVLEFDIRALMCLDPYGTDADYKDLERAELKPSAEGDWSFVSDGSLIKGAEGCRRYEIFQHSHNLSLLVIKERHSRRVDPNDLRVAVGGDAKAAYAVACQLLREDPEYLEGLGFVGNHADAVLCFPDREDGEPVQDSDTD